MGKVTKILLHILSSIVLALVILPVWAAIMLYLPPVQNFAARQAARWAGSKLGATVSIDKVHIRFLNRVVVDGFYVEDLAGDTLLYVNKLDAGLTAKGLFSSGDINLGKVELSDVLFDMNKQPDELSSFKQILEKLRSDKPKEDRKPFRLRMASLRINNMDYRYVKHGEQRRAGVDFGNIDVSGYVSVRELAILGDSISMKIDNISLAEHSGLEIIHLSSDWFSISSSGLQADEMRIVTHESDVSMDYLRLNSVTWAGYKDFVNDVAMEVGLDESRIAFSTIGYFAPALQNWQTVLSGVRGDVAGTVADMSGRIANAQTGFTELGFVFAMRGLPDVGNTRFDVQLERFVSNAADINSIMADVSEVPLSESLVANVEKMGSVELAGFFEGSFSDFRAEGSLVSDEGGAVFNIRLSPSSAGRSAFNGNINVDRLDLGRLLAVEKLGRVSLSVGLDGSFGDKDFTANTNVAVSGAEYNGYRYHDITMNGYVANRLFRGNIGSTDPDIKFDFDGTLDFNDSIPRYDFEMQLFNADLAKLNFNTRDSISILQANLKASASGAGVDDLNGSIVIRDMLYVNHLDSVRTGEMRIVGENNPMAKFLAFRSQFADAEYRSRTSYKQVVADLRSMLHNYMPTFAQARGIYMSSSDQSVAEAGNYSLLNVNIKQANNVAGIFVPGLMVAQGSRMSFMFNPNNEQISLAASSDYIEYGDNFISKLDLNTRNQGDSISLFVRADDIYAGRIFMPGFSIIGGMRENRINARMRMQDTVQNMSALLGVTATLGRDSVSGIPNATLRFTPSTITGRGKLWNVYTRSIVIDSTKVDVDGFVIHGDGQTLQVYGRASRHRSDTLHMELSNFDMGVLTQLTNRMGYRVEGVTNGHGDLMSALEGGIFHARINFDSVRVNDVKLPDGLFESTWDFQRERARFALSARENGDTTLQGFYNPADGRYLAEVRMRNVDMSLLDPMLEGVISNTTGKATVAAQVTGQRRALKVNGSVGVKDLSTNIDFLNVRYGLPSATIAVKDNVMTLDGVSLRDPQGNGAPFDMKVDLSSLSNVRYDFNIRPANMLVLNTTEKDNQLFYGRVFATGAANIRGDKAGVAMDIKATTARNSEFYLPLSDASTMGVSDIITFVTPENKEKLDSTDYLVRKNLIINRRRRQGKVAGAGRMDIKMEVNVLPNTEFQMLIDPRVGDILRGRGTGILTLYVNPQNDEFTMYGDVQISEGSYQYTFQDIMSFKFAIEEGSSITWTGNPTDALLNVTAVRKLRASLAPLIGSGYSGTGVNVNRAVPVECRIMLGDRLSQPSVTFNVEVPGAEPQMQAVIANALGTQESMAMHFFSLIAANSFYPQGGMENIGTSVQETIALDFLTSQISNMISNDRFNVGIKYTPKSTTSSDEVMLDFSTQLFGNRLLLEVEGNYDTGNNPQSMNTGNSNITGDFYLTWLIDRAGNLRAKGFTRTLDRFDYYGEQESGVGLYYREDFDKAGDIVRNFRNRFRSRRKREALAAEEEQKRAIPEEGGESEPELPPWSPRPARPGAQADSVSSERPVIQNAN